MKIISTGIKYNIYPDDLKSYDDLPAGFYTIRFSPEGGFWLEQYPEFAITDAKIYGIHIQKVDKVMHTFQVFDRNLGVILSGDKGIGKSLFARMLGKKAVSQGIPVIIVDRYIEGVGTFIDEIDQEVMVLFDEFDKTFAERGKGDPQVTMLSLFDGVSPGKKLFVVTCNDLRNLNGFMVNRPGRFHYHFRFDYPGAKDIQEYLSDVLDDGYKGEIDHVIEFSNRIGLNYDCLRSIAFELNQGLSFSEAIKDINIVNVQNESFNLKAIFKDGTALINRKIFMDPFSENEITVDLYEKRGEYGGEITFLPSDLKYDPQTGDLFVEGPDVTMDYYNSYNDDAAMARRKEFLNKGLLKIIVHRVYHKSLHYAV